MRHFYFTLILLFFAGKICAQNPADSTGNKLKISAFAEMYYGRDFDRPADNLRPPYFFSHNKNDEISLNLVYIRAEYSDENVRGAIALASGTYMHYNYAAEESTMRNLYEAYAGFRAGKVWFDAGIFASHLGFESAQGPENLTLGRTLLAESTPYYLSGLRATWAVSEQWQIGAVISNGWQNIRETPGNSYKSWGTALAYSPNENLTINWGTFFGNEAPDSLAQFRIVNDFSLLWEKDKFSFRAGYDIGRQAGLANSSAEFWQIAAAAAAYRFSEKWALTGSWQYLSDKSKILTSAEGGEGPEIQGFSFGLDCKPADGFLLRAEYRRFSDSFDNFRKADGSLGNTYSGLTFSLSKRFN